MEGILIYNAVRQQKNSATDKTVLKFVDSLEGIVAFRRLFKGAVKPGKPLTQAGFRLPERRFALSFGYSDRRRLLVKHRYKDV
ncbi:hypothetical protein D3C76_1817560 [compost metagenome]